MAENRLVVPSDPKSTFDVWIGIKDETGGILISANQEPFWTLVIEFRMARFKGTFAAVLKSMDHIDISADLDNEQRLVRNQQSEIRPDGCIFVTGDFKYHSGSGERVLIKHRKRLDPNTDFVFSLRQCDGFRTVELRVGQESSWKTERDLIPRAITHRPLEETFMHQLKYIDDVEVKRATMFYGGHEFDENEFYRMESKPRGLALIIVNTFEGGPKPLSGARRDLELMTQLLTEMGYEVHWHVNRPKSQTEAIVKEFASKRELEKVDSCIVAISSHGNNEGFECSDGSIYPIQSLKAAFDNKNCPELKGKPKIFFIQACRGRDKDPGVPLDTEAAGRRSGDGVYVPSVGDMFVFRSCQEGYISYVNNGYGSWLFDSIVRVFTKFAWRDELKDLITKVSREVEKIKSCEADDSPSNEMKQAPDFSYCGSNKKFYFNPAGPFAG